MAERLLKAFEIAKQLAGTQAQFRLAIRSGMSMVKAEKEQDSEVNISKMKIALKQVLGKEVDM